MYRESADPNVTEELHSLPVSTAKGGELVGFLFAMSLLFAIAEVVTLFAGAPPEIEANQWVMIAGMLVLGVVALLMQQKRRRRLAIVRHGDAIRLVVAGTGVELEFPLVCHGMQMTTRLNRIPVHEVYLQLVDDRRRAVMLHTTRGAIHGPQPAWFPDDLDRSVTSARFDVSGADTLAMIRDWVEALVARGRNDPKART